MIFSKVGLGGWTGGKDPDAAAVAPTLEYEVLGLTSMFENAVVEVYESFRECSGSPVGAGRSWRDALARLRL